MARRAPRSPGFTGAARPHRVATTLEQLRIQVRAEHEDSHPGGPALSEWEVTLEAGRRLERQLAMAFAPGRPEIRRVLRELSDPDHHSLQRAYGHPLRGQCGISEPAVGRALKGALERTDPGLLLDLNVRALRRLRELGHPDIGRRFVLDGTSIRSPRPDRQGYSVAERGLIAGGLAADLGRHGGDDRQDKVWHGWTLLVLVDLASTLPVVWLLVPASEREFAHVPEVLDLLLHRWPDCPLEILVGDREYDAEALCWTLESGYGVHPCFPRRGAVSHEHQWAATGGVPRCERHGALKLIQSEGFVEPRKRLALGLAPGEKADLSGARMRWVCEDEACGARATTRPRKNPRLYTWLPHGGEHRRAGLRAALLHRRNAAESVMDNLKDRIGHGGAHSPKWLSSDRQMEWLAGGSLLSQTLRALTHESGLYQSLSQESLRGSQAPMEHRVA